MIASCTNANSALLPTLPVPSLLNLVSVAIPLACRTLAHDFDDHKYSHNQKNSPKRDMRRRRCLHARPCKHRCKKQQHRKFACVINGAPADRGRNGCCVRLERQPDSRRNLDRNKETSETQKHKCHLRPPLTEVLRAFCCDSLFRSHAAEPIATSSALNPLPSA